MAIVVSASPSDEPVVLFLAAELVHEWWMDVFGLHVSIHFIPAPLPVLFIVFTLSLAGWAAASLGRRRTAAATLIATLVVVGGALTLRSAPPATLDELRQSPQLALYCALDTPTAVAVSRTAATQSG